MSLWDQNVPSCAKSNNPNVTAKDFCHQLAGKVESERGLRLAQKDFFQKNLLDFTMTKVIYRETSMSSQLKKNTNKFLP